MEVKRNVKLANVISCAIIITTPCRKVLRCFMHVEESVNQYYYPAADYR